MSKLLVYTSRKYAAPATSRAFSTCFSNRDEKPVMNRYSRIVTQPKDQGASQVSFGFDLTTLIGVYNIRALSRRCFMLLTGSIRMMISTKPWLEWRVFGTWFPSFVLAGLGLIITLGTRGTRESCSHDFFFARLRGLLEVVIVIYWAWDSVPRHRSLMLVSSATSSAQ